MNNKIEFFYIIYVRYKELTSNLFHEERTSKYIKL